MTKITLSGVLPSHAKEALALLHQDLGFEIGAGGMPVRCTQGQQLEVLSDGKTVDITWSRPV